MSEEPWVEKRTPLASSKLEGAKGKCLDDHLRLLKTRGLARVPSSSQYTEVKDHSAPIHFNPCRTKHRVVLSASEWMCESCTMVYKVKAVGITTEQTPCALQSYQALQIVCARLAGQANDSIQLQPRAIFKMSFFFLPFFSLRPFPIHRQQP